MEPHGKGGPDGKRCPDPAEQRRDDEACDGQENVLPPAFGPQPEVITAILARLARI